MCHVDQVAVRRDAKLGKENEESKAPALLMVQSVHDDDYSADARPEEEAREGST